MKLQLDMDLQTLPCKLDEVAATRYGFPSLSCKLDHSLVAVVVLVAAAAAAAAAVFLVFYFQESDPQGQPDESPNSTIQGSSVESNDKAAAGLSLLIRHAGLHDSCRRTIP
jgi:hypothetical protein